MGCKFSILSSWTTAVADNDEDYSDRNLKVMIVARDASLREYTTRVTAAEAAAGGGGGSAVCNSDKIFFDAFPPAIPPEELLEAGQLYFLFEAAELRRRVTGGDMAALASRASRALQGRRMQRPKVMLVVELIGGFGGAVDGERMVAGDAEKKRKRKKKKSGLTPIGGVERLRRVLSTVHEVNEE